jgi:hypothetical protein
MTEPMKRGALARTVTETLDVGRPSYFGTRLYPVGFEFEVEDYVSAEESEDGKAFYWGNAEGGGNNICVAAADVEQAKSAEEMAARVLPGAKELLDFAVSALLTGRDEIEVTETSRSGGVIEGYGKTEDGLTFGFTMLIPQISIWRTDD